MTDHDTILDFETLTERLEDLETKKEDLETLDQSHNRLETISEILSGLEISVMSINKLRTLETRQVRESQSEIDSEIRELTGLTFDLSQTEISDFLIYSETVREYIEISDNGEYETLDKSLTKVKTLTDLINDQTETLEDLETGLREIRSHLTDSIDQSFESLSDHMVLSYFDQSGLFSETRDNLKRIDQTLRHMSDILEDLETVSDSLETVSESIETLKKEIVMRVLRLRERVKHYETLETGQMISDQLKENTGRSFLDSGGYPQYDSDGNYTGSSQGYGRGYERRQSIDYEKTKRVYIDPQYDLEISINTYHFLRDCLEFDPVIMGLFMEYDSLDPDQYWSESVKGLIETFDGLFSVSGIYGEGQSFGVNTYNHDSLLSEVIQYDFFSLPNGQSYVCLMTHNGADVRGGYSRPVVYYLSDHDQTGLLRDSEVSVYIDPDPEIIDLIDYGQGHIYGQIESGYHIHFDQDLETLCPYYDWSGKQNKRDLRSLEAKIKRLEDLIREYVTVRDPESESDRETLDSLMAILDKSQDKHEGLSDWRVSRGSLSVSSFQTIDREDLRDLDPQEIVSQFCLSDQPTIVYWRDPETSDYILKVMGLGIIDFDYYID